ncbi:MAG: hypothetical protein GXY61_06915 [Lentisphaerae bacterium]|jgi:hypothetical protein|nr:hypothetical protein [Lentisphaerota bacterium]
MKIIIDTCVWSLALRRPASETPQKPVSELKSLTDQDFIHFAEYLPIHLHQVEY